MITVPRRRRKTFQQMLLDALDRRTRGGQQSVSNDTILRELGWEKCKDRYDRVKQELIDAKVVT